jgi:hypothetical protein
VNIERFIRPSSLGAIALCNGRPTMEAAVVEAEGEPTSSPVADLGTDLHARTQQAIEGWKLAQETGEHGATWGDTIALACNEATADGVDSWSVRCLQLALEFARDLIAKHDIHPDNVLTEHRLDMASLGFTKGGTADLVLVVPEKLVVVIDWKYGFLDQGDADDHDQTSAYAAAAAETFDCDKVLVYLCQPRAEKAHRYSGAEYPAETLRKNRAWTAAVIRLARGADPQLDPSYAACVHCRALTRCAAAKEYIVRAQEALALIGPPADPDAWGDLIGAAKLAEKWADQVKDQGKAYVSAGGVATGWKLGTPRALRSISAVALALQKLDAAGMMNFAMEAISMSPTKLPQEALAIIADHVAERLSDPPLVADKRKPVAA